MSRAAIARHHQRVGPTVSNERFACFRHPLYLGTIPRGVTKLHVRYPYGPLRVLAWVRTVTSDTHHPITPPQDPLSPKPRAGQRPSSATQTHRAKLSATHTKMQRQRQLQRQFNQQHQVSESVSQ